MSSMFFLRESNLGISGRVQPQSQPVSSCDQEEQKRFAACIQPITTFQPHPLAVIKQPKQIDDACKQFIEFKKCQAVVSCFPLWAKGMSAMFEFACGPGYNTYLQVTTTFKIYKP